MAEEEQQQLDETAAARPPKHKGKVSRPSCWTKQRDLLHDSRVGILAQALEFLMHGCVAMKDAQPLLAWVFDT